MLLRLAYLGVTNVFALLRLLPVSSRDKDAEILALRHQLLVLQRQLGPRRGVSARLCLCCSRREAQVSRSRWSGCVSLGRRRPWLMSARLVRLSCALLSAVRSRTVVLCT